LEPNNTNNILVVKNLSVRYITRKNIFSLKGIKFSAVENVSFNISKGETLGLVGESGCGKSTVAKAILRLFNKNLNEAEILGEILLNTGDKFVNLQKLKNSEMRKYRNLIQIIFQDPYSTLNPRFTIGKIIEEPLLYNTFYGKKKRNEKVKYIMESIGISPNKINSYPFEFSGGQRQRISIGRALATEPKIIIADEPVSSLDVSIQAQILNLLSDLQKEFNLSMLFISHDLSVVKQICNNIAVMYKGQIVESGSSNEVYFHPKNEYTKLLISSIPGIEENK
jgi:ABC-type oligopeptide transport system ATPase subunit